MKIKRILAIAAAALVGLELVYLVVMNLFLQSQTAQALMSKHPEIVTIHYSKIRSYYPFQLSVENFRMTVQDPNIQMEITGEKARARIGVLSIFTKKTVVVSGLRAEGVSFKMRERKLPKDFLRGEVAKYPPIPEFDTPVLSEPKPAPPDDEHYNLVSVDLRDIDGRDIREIWVDDYHFEGHVDASGGFFLKPLRKLRLDSIKFEVKDGKVFFGNEVVCERMAMKVEANVPELDVKDFRQNALAVMDLGLKLDTHVPDATFINFYLKDIPEVRITDGAGQISVLLDIKSGKIIPGSKAAMDTTKIRVNIPELAATGKGKIRWLARPKDAWLDVKVTDIELTQLRSGKVKLKGPQFNLTAVTSGLDLSKPMNLSLVLDLPSAHADDLTFLSDYIPKGTGVSVSGGKGTVSGNLEIDAAKQKARGNLQIDGDHITVKTRGAIMRGFVRVRGVVPSIDLKTGTVDFAGSSIALNDIVVEAEGRTFEKFWLKVDAKECRLSGQMNLKWFARLEVGFQSLLPIMSVISSNVPVPWVLKAFSDLRDVHINVTMRVHPGGVELPNLAVQSGILHLDGDMHLREVKESYEPFGNLLVKVGAIPIGVSLEGKSARPVLVEAEKWFIRERVKWEQEGKP